MVLQVLCVVAKYVLELFFVFPLFLCLKSVSLRL